MMDYLVVCNHLRRIVNADSALLARERFTCKSCVQYELKNGKYTFGDVRVYLASAKDIEIVGSGKAATVTPRKEPPPQLDWIRDT